MGADEDLQPLGRTLSFASKTASLSICGGNVTAVQTTGGATSSDHTAARGLSKNASAPTLPLGTTDYALGSEQARSGRSSPFSNLSGSRTLKLGGRYTSSVKTLVANPLGRKKAFPFGTGDMPFISTRKGGSINIPTTVFRNKTRVPMGMAGVVEQELDRAFTHLDPYCRDRFGDKNFYLSDHAMSAAGANAVFEQISERPRDDLDRLIAIDCRNARYLQ
ncbi:unnamed protein product [Amoebophrya sp. A120]|nr:unnamed protein product [Amoebophrya sp. A120]|eukprot:GSA120T00019060001.1